MTTAIDGNALATLDRAIPKQVLQIAHVLARAGHRTWVVGGSLRDQLRQVLDPTQAADGADWDLATDARPKMVQGLFDRVIPTGIKHGTVTVLIGHHGYEVTTLRGEADYSDGRRPDSVYFVEEIHEDLARRDFTVNAIAYDPLSRQLEDPFDGIGDLRRRIIRAVGSARERFGEDGLRVLRAARFVATLEFELDPDTAHAIRPSLDSFRKVSPERVRDEWVKAMKGREPSRAFRVMRQHGLLEITAPALVEAPDSDARFDVALSAVDECRCSMHARFAALLHNVGDDRALPSATTVPEAPHAAALAHGLLQSLRFSNKDRDRVVALVRHHRPFDPASRTDADLRRWLKRVGPEVLDDLEGLLHAVAHAHFGVASTESSQVARLFERLRDLLRQRPPLQIGDLDVKGGELKLALGIAPGPLLGEALAALLDLVLEHPEQNQKELLIAAARQWLQGRA